MKKMYDPKRRQNLLYTTILAMVYEYCQTQIIYGYGGSGFEGSYFVFDKKAMDEVLQKEIMPKYFQLIEAMDKHFIEEENQVQSSNIVDKYEEAFTKAIDDFMETKSGEKMTKMGF